MDRYGGKSDVWTGMVGSQMYGQIWWAVRCMDRCGGQLDVWTDMTLMVVL